MRAESCRPRRRDAALAAGLQDHGQHAQIGFAAPMEPTNSQDDFIPAGLAAFGVEADEIELAVIGAAYQLFWPPILELIALDTSQVPAERNPELSQAPPR